MIFSLGSWFGGSLLSLLFADVLILLLLTMKSWSTWDVWNWFSQTTYHSQLLQKCPLPQKVRWMPLGIKRYIPESLTWRHGKKQAFQVEDIYLLLKISIKVIYIYKVICYGAMLVFQWCTPLKPGSEGPEKGPEPESSPRATKRTTTATLSLHELAALHDVGALRDVLE